MPTSGGIDSVACTGHRALTMACLRFLRPFLAGWVWLLFVACNEQQPQPDTSDSGGRTPRPSSDGDDDDDTGPDVEPTSSTPDDGSPFEPPPTGPVGRRDASVAPADAGTLGPAGPGALDAAPSPDELDASVNPQPPDASDLPHPREPDASTSPVVDAGAEAITDAEASDAAGPPSKTVFVTSASYTGMLYGPGNADALCATHASAAQLRGTFKAWLSTLEVAAPSRLSQAPTPYERTDGVRVTNDFDGFLGGSLLAPINRDEFGDPASGDVWTGTLSTGEPYALDDCDGFNTSLSARHAQCGSTSSSGAAWTENIVPACSSLLRLYCFEQ